MYNLKRTLHKIDTDPELIKIIISYLNTWRDRSLLQPIPASKYRQLLELQDTIGARQFFEGWLHVEWEQVQAQYYTGTNSKRSGKWWTIALINKLWEVAWDLWDFRNAVCHHQVNQSLQADIEILDAKIRELLDTATITGFLPKDEHLMSIPITRLLSFPRSHKVEWLEQASLALAHAKKRNFWIRESRIEQQRRHREMIRSMQRNFCNWHNTAS
jgi:hypothetical protein